MFMELAHLQLRNKEREREYSETSRFIQCCGPIQLNYLFLSRFFKDFSNTCDVERAVCKRKSPPFQYSSSNTYTTL